MIHKYHTVINLQVTKKKKEKKRGSHNLFTHDFVTHSTNICSLKNKHKTHLLQFQLNNALHITKLN